MTLVDTVCSAIGRLYEITGRETCDNCGGPLEAGCSHTLTLTEEDVETTATRARFRLTLCDTCVRAGTLQMTDNGELSKQLKARALEEIV